MSPEEFSKSKPNCRLLQNLKCLASLGYRESAKHKNNRQAVAIIGKLFQDGRVADNGHDIIDGGASHKLYT